MMIPTLNNLPSVHDTTSTETGGTIPVTLQMVRTSAETNYCFCQFMHTYGHTLIQA